MTPLHRVGLAAMHPLPDGTRRSGLYCIECSTGLGNYQWPCAARRDPDLPPDGAVVTAKDYTERVGALRALLTEVVVAVFDSRPSAMTDDLWERLVAAAPKPPTKAAEVPVETEESLW
jgi:hypothetical protein